MGSTSDTCVTRRKVFYIPGYDPFPPRRYRELYRAEGAAQAAISGYTLGVQGTTAPGAFGWQVQTHTQGQATQTDIEVLVWSDIVQDSFHDSILRTYVAMIRTAWIYISTGGLWRLMRLRKGPVIAALYPVVMLLAQLAAAVAVGAGVGALACAVVWPMAPGWVGLSVAGACAIGVAVWVLRWCRDRDGRIFAHYLMHDFAHSASARGGYPPDLRARMDSFADRVGTALQSDVEEVLVVGHSSGAHLAVSVLADVVRRGQANDTHAALGFLSLGQVVPMVAFLPNAQDLRRDLRDLSTCAQITWVDVTAPGDGCTFALCDPVSICGQGTPEKRWPLVISAAFTQTLSPQRWRALRWRFFRLHFQYLCAFDQPRDYDYFQITAGPRTLGARYAGRRPSGSRIETVVSRYTDVGA